ncbi:MAG TPA: chemotaxis protein CheW [Candidatus Acidoferrales bacterium]|nr:chemotaxis protein CheW [Candidatus Acidoferrales bacterium]
MKIVSSGFQPPRQRARTEEIILFAVAGYTFAIAASAIEEIRSTDGFSSATAEITLKEIPKVRHRLRRERKWYYVVNASVHFDLPVSRPTLILVLRHSCVAALVDRIDRMETISRLMAIPRSFSGPERVWYRGLTLIDNNVVPVLNPDGFLTRDELAQLRALDDRAGLSSEDDVLPLPGKAEGALL